jgi:hypothetical protein
VPLKNPVYVLSECFQIRISLVYSHTVKQSVKMRDKGGSGMGIKATDMREYMICEKPGMKAGVW